MRMLTERVVRGAGRTGSLRAGDPRHPARSVNTLFGHKEAALVLLWSLLYLAYAISSGHALAAFLVFAALYVWSGSR